MYQLNQAVAPRGTANQGYIRAFPKRVKQLFGEPVHYPGDDECLGNYVFTAENGEVTTLYCMAYDAPNAKSKKARAEFWNYSGIVELHIGATNPGSAAAFRKWLEARLAEGTAL